MGIDVVLSMKICEYKYGMYLLVVFLFKFEKIYIMLCMSNQSMSERKFTILGSFFGETKVMTQSYY